MNARHKASCSGGGTCPALPTGAARAAQPEGTVPGSRGLGSVSAGTAGAGQGPGAPSHRRAVSPASQSCAITVIDQGSHPSRFRSLSLSGFF